MPVEHLTFVKLCKYLGWFMIVVGVPLLIIPPLGLGFFMIAGILLWTSKRVQAQADALHAAMLEAIEEQEKRQS